MAYQFIAGATGIIPKTPAAAIEARPRTALSAKKARADRAEPAHRLLALPKAVDAGPSADAAIGFILSSSLVRTGHAPPNQGIAYRPPKPVFDGRPMDPAL
jgi:hypothetical protein